MLVSEWMMPEPFKVSTREPVDRIAALIRVHRIRQVPVVDESNRLVGIVTDRDIRTATGGDHKRKRQLVAEEIMTRELVTIHPGANLLEAAQLLHAHQFGALPVVCGDQVVGMITTSQLLRRLIEVLEAGEIFSSPRERQSWSIAASGA